MFLVQRTDTFAKLFFVVSCIGLFVYTFLAFYTFHVAYSRKFSIQKNGNSMLVTSSFDNDEVKYILIWSFLNTNVNYYNEGPYSFINNKCLYHNCYLTENKLLLDDIKKYDAVIFDSQVLNNRQNNEMPRERSPHQKYIFYSMESADESPVCNINAYKFFNLTCTYKLDSDIVSPYIEVRDFSGNYIAPKINITWNLGRKLSSEEYILKSKKIAMMWVVRKCASRNNIITYAKRLQVAFRQNNLQFHIFGCGFGTCPKEGCWKLLEREYYFYFAPEYSNAEDFVTTEVLDAYEHNAVPVVAGGADYHRFLPDGTYINTGSTGPDNLAALVDYIIKKPDVYYSFFRYKKYYKIQSTNSFDPFCKICEYLNNSTHGVRRVKENFRQWWNKLPLSNRCLPKNHNSVKFHLLK